MEFIENRRCTECGSRLMLRRYSDKSDTVVCAKCGYQPGEDFKPTDMWRKAQPVLDELVAKDICQFHTAYDPCTNTGMVRKDSHTSYYIKLIFRDVTLYGDQLQALTELDTVPLDSDSIQIDDGNLEITVWHKVEDTPETPE